MFYRLFLIAICLSFSVSSSPAFARITDDQLAVIVAQINEGLPAMRDKITRIDKVEAAPNAMILYSNTLRKITTEELARRNLKKESFVAYLTPVQKNHILNNDQMMNFLQRGGRFQYDYFLETGEPFFTLEFARDDFTSVP